MILAVKIVFLVALIGALLGYGLGNYTKIAAAQKNGTLMKRGAKQIVLFGIRLLASVLLLITPVFGWVSIKGFRGYSISGMDILLVNEDAVGFLLDEDLTFVLIILMAIFFMYISNAILQLSKSIGLFFLERDEAQYARKAAKPVKALWAGSIIYLVFSAVITIILNEEMGDAFGLGASFVPLILCTVLTVCYGVCGRMIPNSFSFSQLIPAASKATNEPVKAEEVQENGATVAAEKEDISKKNAVEELKACKELLDCGIISQEEFESKKAELLNRI